MMATTTTDTTASSISTDALQHALSPPHTSIFARLWIPFRLFWIFLIAENPLYWERTRGKNNVRADVEGPFYLLGAPGVNIAPGKALLASLQDLKDSKPFLFVLRVCNPDGKPAAGVEFDWWQADCKGGYYFATHRLRGKFKTDENGYVEVLTVPPYGYGVPGTNGFRPGHGHAIVSPPAEHAHEWNGFTTQLYVIDGNKSEALHQDPIKYIRLGREQNVVKGWCVPEANDGNPYMEFPPVDADNTDLKTRISWWNELLARLGPYQVVAGTKSDFTLTKKADWL